MIRKLKERFFRSTLKDFNELSENNNDICNRHRNVKILLIEVFKMKNELATPIMDSTLNRRFNNYMYTFIYKYQETTSTKADTTKVFKYISLFSVVMSRSACLQFKSNLFDIPQTK